MSKVEYGILSVQSLRADDSRRTIREFNFKDCGIQDFLVRSDPRPQGQHFHKNKFELFYFLEGSGTVMTREVKDPAGELRTFEIRPGSAILIPTSHAHRFNLEPRTRFVCFSSKPFDEKDIIPCPIYTQNEKMGADEETT